MLNDRDITPSEHELAPPTLFSNNVEYVRRESFKDGQRVFFSPLDFALNGPVVTIGTKTVMSRSDGRHDCSITVLEKHHEPGDPVPCYVTVSVKWSNQLMGVVEEGLADIITKDCEIVREHFGFTNYTQQGHNYFAITPHFWREQGLYKNPHLPYNRITKGIELVTGISAHTLVSDDRYV
jgi:hypothetical protein